MSAELLGLGKNRQRCRVCGEWIANAVPRTGELGSLEYVCAECADEHGAVPAYSRDRGAVADMRYHGDRFHDGEW